VSVRSQWSKPIEREDVPIADQHCIRAVLGGTFPQYDLDTNHVSSCPVVRRIDDETDCTGQDIMG
jgi:hypothetical protein